MGRVRRARWGFRWCRWLRWLRGFGRFWWFVRLRWLVVPVRVASSRTHRLVSRITHCYSFLSFSQSVRRTILPQSVISIRHGDDMAALAPFLEYRSAEISPEVGRGWTPGSGLERPEATVTPLGDSVSHKIEREIAERGNQLAAQETISDDLRFFIDELADELLQAPGGAPLRVDPYFLLAAQRALIGSLRALDSDDPAVARRQMRVRLSSCARSIAISPTERSSMRIARRRKLLNGWQRSSMSPKLGWPSSSGLAPEPFSAGFPAPIGSVRRERMPGVCESSPSPPITCATS